MFIIPLILYKILKMKKYNGVIYRIDKKGHFILSLNLLDCALGICSPSAGEFYNDIMKKEGLYAH